MRTPLALLIGISVAIGATAIAQQPAAGGRGRGAAQQEAAPPAPPAGSAGTYKSGADLMEVLKKNMSPTGEMTTSAVSNTDQYRINVVHRSKPAGAIAHPGNTELHYIIEGSATVVTGGTINTTGSFVMKAERVGAETVLSQIVQMEVGDLARLDAPREVRRCCLGAVRKDPIFTLNPRLALDDAHRTRQKRNCLIVADLGAGIFPVGLTAR